MNNSKLLIIGNGFDLHVGLKTTYNDFFKWRLKEVFNTENSEEAYQELLKCIATPEHIPEQFSTEELNKAKRTENLEEQVYTYHSMWLNFEIIRKKGQEIIAKYPKFNRWDGIFVFLSHYLKEEFSLWQNIENVIYNVITIGILEQDKLYNIVTDSNKEKRIISNLQSMIKDNSENTDNFSTAQVLLDELKDFEKEFAEYIKIEINKMGSEEYTNKSIALLKNILQLPREIDQKKDWKVLSFNYTLDKSIKSSFNDDNKVMISAWNNIHGLVNWENPNNKSQISPPIFGIDGHETTDSTQKEILANESFSMFTKIFRVSSSQANRDWQNFDFSNLTEIVVYGHSLSPADYTYFFNVFDLCKIYERPVKLKFYYHSTADTDEKDRLYYTRGVYNLLYSYGNSSNNSHGENLMSYLLMTGNLSIISDRELDY